MQKKYVIRICGNPYKRIGNIPTTLEQMYHALLYMKQHKISFEQVYIEETVLDMYGKVKYEK